MSSLQPDAGVATLRSIVAQIAALGDMEPGFDFLLDLLLGFLLRNGIPVLGQAETPIGGKQLR